MSSNIIFEQSFASHIRAQDWSKRNKKNPSQVVINSSTPFLFDCNICHHEFADFVQTEIFVKKIAILDMLPGK